VLLVAVMVAIALARPLFGVAVVHHDHHDHHDLGSHTHCVPVVACADGHATGWHGHDLSQIDLPVHASCSPHCSPLCMGSGCGLMSVVFQSSLPIRTAGQLPDGLIKALATIAQWNAIEPRDLDHEPRSLGRVLTGAPRHLCALSASERLIGTSMALLI